MKLDILLAKCLIIYSVKEIVSLEYKDNILNQMYCGKENCYNVLNVSRNASRNEIKRAYRELSLKYHPDRSGNNRSDAFVKIAQAYEELINEKKRSAYDYFLDHPDSYLAIYFGLRAEYPTPTHPVVLLWILLICGSVLQYWNRTCRRQWEVTLITSSQQYKSRVNKELDEIGRARFRKLSTEKQQEILQAIQAKILDTTTLDGKILGAKPMPFKLADFFVSQVFIYIFKMLRYCLQKFRCFVKYELLKRPIDDFDKERLTIQALKLDELQWKNLHEQERQKYLSFSLWDKSNNRQYHESKKDSQRMKRAPNGSPRTR